MKRFLERVPWFMAALTFVVYAGGVVIRWFYIASAKAWHDPNKYVYSDMRMYVDLAKRIASPTYRLNIGDITHPPGNTWILEWFVLQDPSLLKTQEMNHAAAVFNFVICSLVPLSMGALGWVTFGRRTGQLSVMIASWYFAFIDFGGYFLAEIHITFVATLAIALYLLAMRIVESPVPVQTDGSQSAEKKVLKEETPPLGWKKLGIGIAIAAVAGLLFSGAMALKMVALFGIGGFVAVHFFFARNPRWIHRIIIAAVFTFAAVPLTGKLILRCTKANDGQFCTGSNKSAADFLMGHYGRIQGIEWRDPNVHGMVGFGNPAAYQHGYRSKQVVPFLITNQKKNNEYAWKWVKENKGQALVLSFEHVWDAFGGSYPWPANATGIWPLSYTAHFLFLVFILFPALVCLVDVLRKKGLVGLFRSTEFFVLSPIFGVCLAMFVASGEVRYRIPWDGAFIVLAVEFYRRMTYRFFEPKPEAAVSLPDAALPHPEAAKTPEEAAIAAEIEAALVNEKKPTKPEPSSDTGAESDAESEPATEPEPEPEPRADAESATDADPKPETEAEQKKRIVEAKTILATIEDEDAKK